MPRRRVAANGLHPKAEPGDVERYNRRQCADRITRAVTELVIAERYAEVLTDRRRQGLAGAINRLRVELGEVAASL